MSAVVSTRRHVPWPVTRAVVQTAFLVVAIGAWQLATVRSESVFFPPPSEIVDTLLDLLLPVSGQGLLNDSVTTDLLPSIGRMIAGWSLAVILGVTLGLLIGRSRVLGDYVDPSPPRSP